MKTKIIILFLTFNIITWIASKNACSQDISVSFQVFYDELSPYGTWVDNSDYGYVWIPNVAPGFSPYATNGYWVLTDQGWTWFSNYSWGWAPFHYGRWYIDAIYGPMWIPDNVWGPGWVTWRRSDMYYGWAPIGPGVSISIAYSNGYNVPNNQWTFVKGRDFGRTNINNYYVHSSNNITIINNTTVINNTRVDKTHSVTYNTGPDRSEVEKHTGKPISPIVIKESSKPAQNVSKDQFQIYRPKVQQNTSTGTKPAPSKVASLKDVKSAAQRTVITPTPKTTQPNKQPSSQPQNTKLIKPTTTTKPVQPKQSKPAKVVEEKTQPKPTKKKQPQQKIESPNQQSSPPPQEAIPSKKMEKQKQPK